MANRAERRRQGKTKPKTNTTPKQEYGWKQIFDGKPMADGMPPHFLLYLLNEKDVFERHGKLLTAAVWLQSQMVALICLQDSPELRNLHAIENGRHLPAALAQAAIKRLEELSSESLRSVFLNRFGSSMSKELERDLVQVTLGRDALAHGYLSLFRQITGDKDVVWSPRPSPKRDGTVESIYGPRPENTFLTWKLTDEAFEEEIARICRVMDFIAATVKQWDIHYAVFS